jgi:hypothetical protein
VLIQTQSGMILNTDVIPVIKRPNNGKANVWLGNWFTIAMTEDEWGMYEKAVKLSHLEALELLADYEDD